MVVVVCRDVHFNVGGVWGGGDGGSSCYGNNCRGGSSDCDLGWLAILLNYTRTLLISPATKSNLKRRTGK